MINYLGTLLGACIKERNNVTWDTKIIILLKRKNNLFLYIRNDIYSIIKIKS